VKSAYDFIRGLSPYPAAWTILRTADGKETPLKIYFAEKISEEEAARINAELQPLPQSSLFILHSSLVISLRDGYLRLTDIQLAGKKRMPASDFLRGAHLDGATLI
jgi:methionyl-tRNA formyltransferase